MSPSHTDNINSDRQLFFFCFPQSGSFNKAGKAANMWICHFAMVTEYVSPPARRGRTVSCSLSNCHMHLNWDLLSSLSRTSLYKAQLEEPQCQVSVFKWWEPAVLACSSKNGIVKRKPVWEVTSSATFHDTWDRTCCCHSRYSFNKLCQNFMFSINYAASAFNVSV